MEAIITTSTTVSREFNLYTHNHGNHDHDWDDYLDFSVAKGLTTSSNDYTYGGPTDRGHILPVTELNEEERALAAQLLTEHIFKDERIYSPKMWIGSSNGYNLSLPCNVCRSRKYKGAATLISIVSKRDIYGREIYKALIVGEDKLKYYVSPGCIAPDREVIKETIRKYSFSELLHFVDELIHGHWNFYPYNRHLFHMTELLNKYRVSTLIDIRCIQWAWKVELLESKE